MTHPDRGAGQPPESQLLDVWGDTVDRGHLLKAVIIGGAGGLIPMLIADELFPRVEDNASLAHAYALLVGLVASVLMGVICAKLFPPKRVIVESGADDADRQEVLAVLRSERHGIGSVANLPEETKAEMRELELYDLFRDAESEDATSSRLAGAAGSSKGGQN